MTLLSVIVITCDLIASDVLCNPTKGPKPRREEEAANFYIWEAGTMKYSAVSLC